MGMVIATFEDQGVLHFEKCTDASGKVHSLLILGDTPVIDVVHAKTGMVNARQRAVVKVSVELVPASSVDTAPDLGGVFLEGSEPVEGLG